MSGDASRADPRARIARLQARFTEDLPRRLAQLDEALAALRCDDATLAPLDQLRRHLHSLKGTARTFGFVALGDLAARYESAVDAAEPLAELESCHVALARAMGRDDLLADADAGLPALAWEAPAAEAGAAGCAEVYLCDDEPLVLDQLIGQLRCYGYRCRRFADPVALHEAVRARRPDALVLDIDFPSGHSAGTELLARMREEDGAAVPTIFLSARDDFNARLRAVEAGGEAYFHKPAQATELVAVLDALTRQQVPDPLRVLVVDDELEVAEYHSIVLQNAGMITRVIDAPGRVLQLLAEFRPDLVLLDMYMPLCHGRDLAKLIRQVPDHVGLPIVFLSSETDRARQFDAMRIGAEGFLTKPVNPEDLVAAVAIRAERMRTLRSLLARDSLTGLLNHTAIAQMLASTVASAMRFGASLSFVMLDIDHFKQVNDRYGHPAGDQVILALSRVLRQRLRASDVIGRYGGEEFAIVLPDTEVGQAARLLDALRSDFARLEFGAEDGSFRVTFSAGLAGCPQYGSMEALLDAADRALYRAKHQGRDRIVIDEATEEGEADD